LYNNSMTATVVHLCG